MPCIDRNMNFPNDYIFPNNISEDAFVSNIVTFEKYWNRFKP